MSALKLEDFKPLLNATFKITFDKDNAYEAELIRITAYGKIEELNIQQFSLLFRSDPKNTIFAQRLYQLSHDELGNHALFFIPRTPDKEGIYYEVIIS